MRGIDLLGVPGKNSDYSLVRVDVQTGFPNQAGCHSPLFGQVSEQRGYSITYINDPQYGNTFIANEDGIYFGCAAYVAAASTSKGDAAWYRLRTDADRNIAPSSGSFSIPVNLGYTVFPPSTGPDSAAACAIFCYPLMAGEKVTFITTNGAGPAIPNDCFAYVCRVS